MNVSSGWRPGEHRRPGAPSSRIGRGWAPAGANSDRGLLATTPCPSGTGPTTPYPLLIKEGNCGKGDHKGHPYNPGLAKGTPWRAPTKCGYGGASGFR